MEEVLGYHRGKDGDICDLVLYQYGKEHCEPNHSFGPATRNFYLMHFVVDGKGVFCENGKTHDLEKGECFMIFPEEITYYKADEQNPWTYYWVGFSGESAERILKRCGIDKNNRIIDAPNFEGVRSQFEAMLACPQNEAKSEFLMLSKLYGLLSELVLTVESEIRNYAQVAAQYIRRNFSSPLGVDRIADMMNVDRTTLYRDFKRAMKCSPTEYLMKIRLGRASEYLKNTKLPIVQICFSCGFNDANYFCKIFKKYYGSTPSKYRETYSSSPTLV